MFGVIGVMIVGIGMGYLLKNHKKIVTYVGNLNMGIICLLLFLMGVSIGNNKEVLANVSDLGLQAILIGVVATLGSVILMSIVSRFILKQKKKTIIQDR